MNRPAAAAPVPSAKRQRTSGAMRPIPPPPPVGFRGIYKTTRRRTKKATKAKRKAKPKVETTASALLALSPFGKTMPPPSAANLGAFVTTNHVTRGTLTTAANAAHVLVFAPSVNNGYNVLCWTQDGAVSGQYWTLSSSIYLNEYNSSPKPSSWRALRAGLKIRCLSSADDRAGYVQALVTSSPMQLQFANASAVDANGVATGTNFNISGIQWLALQSMVANNTDAKCLTAEQLAHQPHSFISFPAGFNSYQSWTEDGVVTANPLDVNGQVQHAKIKLVADNWTNSEKKAGLSTTIMYFSPTATAQNYLIETGLQAAERHFESSSMGSLMRVPNAARDADAIRRQQQLVERAGGHMPGEHPGFVG